MVHIGTGNHDQQLIMLEGYEGYEEHSERIPPKCKAVETLNTGGMPICV